jgi:hypothetical protein
VPKPGTIAGRPRFLYIIVFTKEILKASKRPETHQGDVQKNELK